MESVLSFSAVCRAGHSFYGPCLLHNIALQKANTGEEHPDPEPLLFISSNNTSIDDESAILHYRNDMTMQIATASPSSLEKTCINVTTFGDMPVVLMARDLPNVFHVLGRQLLPLFTALHSFGLSDGPFQVVVRDEPGYQAALGGRNDR